MVEKSNHIQFTKVKFDYLIDIKLDEGFYPDQEIETEYEKIEHKPRRCFPKRKDMIIIFKELLKSNPKII